MFNNRPALHMGELHLYYADLRNYRIGWADIPFSPDEQERAKKIRSCRAYLHYKKTRYLLKDVLAGIKHCSPDEIIFNHDKNGKPSLYGEPPEGVQFNMSHSEDFVVVAVCLGRRVGIDIEKVRDDIPAKDIAGRFYSSTETEAIADTHGLQRSELFLRIWTRKEALLKGTGEGIGSLCSEIQLLSECNVLRDGAPWQVHDLEVSPGYVSALAIEGEEEYTIIRTNLT